MVDKHQASGRVLGVILAGGLSSRMGRPDKFFLVHNGVRLIDRIIERASPQVDQLVISANGDPERFSLDDLPIIADQKLYPLSPKEPQGPLSGILSVMKWALELKQNHQWLMTFPGDSPHFPLNCVDKLKTSAIVEQLDVCYPNAAGRNEYAFGLWSMNLFPTLLEQYIKGERALKRSLNHYSHGSVHFDTPENAFLNLNTPEEWDMYCRNTARE